MGLIWGALFLCALLLLAFATWEYASRLQPDIGRTCLVYLVLIFLPICFAAALFGVPLGMIGSCCS
jgi:hypothetical protein